jgi:3-hydroxyanthranilate 3,4-dioxygenase
MSEMQAIHLGEIGKSLSGAMKPVRILWQAPDSIAFVARGREHRSEFHVDPSDEVMYVIKGQMDLHYLTPDGEQKIAVVREGEVIYCPAGTPHSPRFAPDAYLFVLERKRHPDEQDRFYWYCERCNAPLYEAVRHVTDYRDDPVSGVYQEFYASEAARTCGACGHVTPDPRRR